jgi:hypothetical protein
MTDSIDVTVNSKTKWLFLDFGIIVAGLFLAFLTYRKAGLDYGVALTHYKINSYDEAKIVAGNINVITTNIYKNLRTISLLPSVKKIDRHGSNLDKDDHETIQQIYNNLASSVSVSEVYIVPADLDPDKLDPFTGKPEEPILMFDQLIVGRSLDEQNKEDTTKQENAGHEPIEEIEIYEYRLMREQQKLNEDKARRRPIGAGVFGAVLWLGRFVQREHIRHYPEPRL